MKFLERKLTKKKENSKKKKSSKSNFLIKKFSIRILLWQFSDLKYNMKLFFRTNEVHNFLLLSVSLIHTTHIQYTPIHTYKEKITIAGGRENGFK